MTRIPYPLCALAALVLFLAMDLAPRADSSVAPATPTASVSSHDSLTDVLRAGLGSKNEKGFFDLYSTDPLVSSDIVGTPYSVTIDGGLTMAMGNLVKVNGWYDNEWGYSNRLVDLTKIVGAANK